jgi:hypothetical protein
MYSLTFYERRLIDILYYLVANDWEPLHKALQEKFGRGSASDKVWTWQNSASSMSVERDAEDLSGAKLRIWFDREYSEFLQRFQHRKDSDAKDDL